MEYNVLGDSGIKVSRMCLGTMTFGEQNTEAEGHEQLSYAIDQGINFVDTAEMYSVPGRQETQGSTERIVGSWLSKNGNRDKVVLATKVTGPSPGMSYIRNPMAFTHEQIRKAIEGSLGRLQTDYVDLYQLHWPERKTNYFGRLGFKYDEEDPWEDNFEEVVGALFELKKEGKIRHFGISNETSWGLYRVEQVANELKADRCVSIQNPYSLLNRTYEIGLAEMSVRTGIGLLAYSPLAMGLLSGKYLNGALPEDARLVKFKQFSRYANDIGRQATAEYAALADKFGMSLAQMSLAFVNQQKFLTSTIIGATSMDQLKENIGSTNVSLSQEMLSEIDGIHHRIPNPNP